MSEESLHTLALVALGGGMAVAGYLAAELGAWLRDRRR